MHIKNKYLVITFFILPISFFMLGFIGIYISNSISPIIGSLIGISMMVAFAIAAQMIGNIRCPKCHTYLLKQNLLSYRFTLPNLCPQCNLDLSSTEVLIFHSPEDQKEMSNGEKDFIIALILILGTLFTMFIFMNKNKTTKIINTGTSTIDSINSKAKE